MEEYLYSKNLGWLIPEEHRKEGGDHRRHPIEVDQPLVIEDGKGKKRKRVDHLLRTKGEEVNKELKKGKRKGNKR